jgi:indole-3-glycerol phosphate synthase
MPWHSDCYVFAQIAKAYEAGGAACLSVLTDAKYFQGSFDYLALCKEFIVEAYQLFKARASGADAVLLIAAVLPNSDLAYLIKAANKCGLQVLVEVHTIAGGATPHMGTSNTNATIHVM